MPAFDIIDDPWLDVVRVDGTLECIGLRALLYDLHRVAHLSEPSALTEAGLLRFLTALVSDGLREFVPTEDDWFSFVESCCDGLPGDAVKAVLKPIADVSDVLARDHNAFFDAAAVSVITGWDESTAWQPASRFLPETPTGTNLTHFDHLSDDTTAVCVGCLLKGRAVDSAFARGGLGPSLSRNLLATISGSEPRYVIAVGRTLLETLLLNLVVGDASRPVWCSIHRSADGDAGPIARLSWRPRLVIPVASSESGQPCVCCGTEARPRFRHAVMADTYNYPGSPFGSKADLERWKLQDADPQLVAFEGTGMTFGLTPAEWAVRALVPLLAETSGDCSLVRRAGHLGSPLSSP